MAESFLIKGILIGLFFGIPVGAVGILTVQRTFRHGLAAGLKTGLGSSAADCFYAACGAFGLTFISDFLLKHQMIISIAGGCLILGMGIRLFFRREGREIPEKQDVGNVKIFLSSFVVGITNPAAILTFLFAFSFFGITGKTKFLEGICLVAGVFIGTFLWWCILSESVILLKKRAESYTLSEECPPHWDTNGGVSSGYSLWRMNQIFGAILILFGIVVFMRTFL